MHRRECNASQEAQSSSTSHHRPEDSQVMANANLMPLPSLATFDTFASAAPYTSHPDTMRLSSGSNLAATARPIAPYSYCSFNPNNISSVPYATLEPSYASCNPVYPPLHAPHSNFHYTLPPMSTAWPYADLNSNASTGASTSLRAHLIPTPTYDLQSGIPYVPVHLPLPPSRGSRRSHDAFSIPSPAISSAAPTPSRAWTPAKSSRQASPIPLDPLFLTTEPYRPMYSAQHGQCKPSSYAESVLSSNTSTRSSRGILRATTPLSASIASSSLIPLQPPYQPPTAALYTPPDVRFDWRIPKAQRVVSHNPIKHSDTTNVNLPTAAQYRSCPSSTSRGFFNMQPVGATGDTTRTVTLLTRTARGALEIALAAAETCPPAKAVFGTLKAILTILEVGICLYSCKLHADDCPECDR